MTTTVPLTEILSKVKLPLHQREAYANMICTPNGHGVCSTGLDYASYIVHAANQLPRLLAALEQIACEPVGKESPQALRALARKAIEDAQVVEYVHTRKLEQNY